MISTRFLVVLLLLSTLCWAQVETARLEGTVVDESGAVIVGAKVIAVNQQTQARAEATANATGNYVFASLQPGKYTISVEAPGFRTAVANDVELNAAVTVTQRFALEV